MCDGRSAALLAVVLAACSGGGIVVMPDAAVGHPDAATCSLPTAGPTMAQTRALIDAYYFDGWTGPADRMHFDGLIRGPFTDREPVTGWFDTDPCAVDLGSATTTATGAFSESLDALGATTVKLEARWQGDAVHWPAFARTA